MASDRPPSPSRRRADEPLRVRLAGPVAFREQAAWVLEALLARARVLDWCLLDPADEDRAADLAWGAEASVTLPCDADAWEFRWDREPDAHADPLAAAFWWLARVEELLAPEDAFDEHGRFRWSASALARLDDPLAAPVDEFAAALGDALEQWQVPRRQGEPAWRLVATHDIDLPWRWTRSGRRRALRAVRDDLRRGRLGRASRTAGALASIPGWWLRRRDPWSNARRIAQLEHAHGASSTHYVIAAHHVAEDGDAELHARGERYVRELGELGDLHELDGIIGLHGSYTSSSMPGRVAEERAVLEERVGRPVTDHRFHYLRHRPPIAWPALERAGISSDSSLGYAEQPGFRAGTAHPYRAWDHELGRPLELVLIPLALMDASLDERYLGIGTDWAGQRLAEQVADRVRELGGSASVLVHNDRLCNAASPGWTALYVRLLELVRAEGGRACTAREAADAYRSLLPAFRSRTEARPGTGRTL